MQEFRHCVAHNSYAYGFAVNQQIPSLDLMGITETNDAGLRQLIHDHPKVLVEFTTAHCAICERLQPVFELFATNQAYAGIAFLRLAADENPVAKQLMHKQAAPFFVSYCQGRLVHCDTFCTEQQLRAQLNALLAHP